MLLNRPNHNGTLYGQVIGKTALCVQHELKAVEDCGISHKMIENDQIKKGPPFKVLVFHTKS